MTSRDAERAALLAEVLRCPDEDSPRLILADWLLDQESKLDHVRGRFIAEDVARNEPFDQANLWAALLMCGGPSLQDLFADPDRGAVIRRGFVESVTCTAADWMQHADAILAAQPLRQVTLTTWPEAQWRDDPVTGRRVFRLRRGKRYLMVAVTHEDMMRLDGPGTMLLGARKLLAFPWPGITFHLPATLQPG